MLIIPTTEGVLQALESVKVNGYPTKNTIAAEFAKTHPDYQAPSAYETNDSYLRRFVSLTALDKVLVELVDSGSLTRLRGLEIKVPLGHGQHSNAWYYFTPTTLVALREGEARVVAERKRRAAREKAVAEVLKRYATEVESLTDVYLREQE